MARSEWDNRTFRLGKNLSVSMPSAESYASQVCKEQRWLPIIREALSTAVPRAIGLGKPGYGYLWSWSIYRWIEGTDVESATTCDMTELVKSIARFIGELHKLDSSDGPLPGQHNYFRGGDLREYDNDTQAYNDLLSKDICAHEVLNI